MTYTSKDNDMTIKLGEQHSAAVGKEERPHHVTVRDYVVGSMNQTGAFSVITKEDTKFGAEIIASGLRKCGDQDASNDQFKILFTKTGDVIITREMEHDAVVITMDIKDIDPMAAYRRVVDKIREVTPEKSVNGRLHTMAHGWIT